MKLGIVASNSDMLTLFKVLTKYDHEYIIYYDQQDGAYGDQSFPVAQKRVEEGVAWLEKQGCEAILLPPVYELLMAHPLVLPLFENYLTKCVFPHSLVGKLGLFGDYADVQVAQGAIATLAEGYVQSEDQKDTKSFQFPFAYWVKEVPLWKSFLQTLSYSAPMVHRVIKQDLSYFKDAGVDTFIPLNYGYFIYETALQRYLKVNKYRFHGLKSLEEQFSSLTDGTQGEYSVTIGVRGHTDFLKRQKRLIWLMQRGQGIAIAWQTLS